VLLLVEDRPAPGPPERRPWRPSRRLVEVVARLVLAALLLAGASVAGGFAGYVASIVALVAVCSAANRAFPYMNGLKEHRQ
jgi:hypothetical protein